MIRGFLCLGVMTHVGCTGAPADPEDVEDTRAALSCEVAESEDFCWATSALEAYACVDSEQIEGTFNAARTECALGDGTVIRFDDAVPSDPAEDDEHLWSFTIESASGSECARFVDGEAGASLRTEGGTTQSEVSGFAGLEVTCPGGEVYYASNAFDLFDCDGAAVPGFSYSSSGGSVSWGFLTTPEDRFALFICADSARR